MSETDPLVGADLGQYHVIEMLGKGGMATVYKATQSTINRTVAIKVLPRSFLHDDTFMHRFRREAELIARLEHFHILPIYDYGEYDGMPYIVMRYLDGGTLQARIRQGPLSSSETIGIIRQVADALDYAHSHNVIHRDIKPSNIMLDRRGNAYLTDFGIAKMGEGTSQLTGSGIVGTPAYMAPEQTKQGPPAPAADVYALGVTLFEMVTGQVPFSADTPIAQILMHLQDPVPSLRDSNPAIPAELDEILHKAMAKSPRDRYARASDLAKAVEKVGASGGWSWLSGQLIANEQTVHFDSAGAMNEAADGLTMPKQAAAPSKSAGRSGGRSPITAIFLIGAAVALVAAVAFGALILPALLNPTVTPAITQPASAQVADVTSTIPSIAPSATAQQAQTEAVTQAPAGITPTSLPEKTTLHGVPMNLVPAGTFIMGSDAANSYPKERPAHEIYLDAFYMDLTEVTNLYYIQCVQEGPCSPPINRNSVNHPSYFSTQFDTYHDYPVINVSWTQSEQYCEWRGGRLPTEAQWEKAARWEPATGQGRQFPWDGPLLNDTRTNYGSHTGETAKVGSFPRGASALGLLDMAGNVAEWVYDWYQDDFYEHSPHDNPMGPETGQARVYRGGSYEDPGAQLTTTFRQAAGPPTTFMTVGFRCAWTPGSGAPPPVITPTN